MATYKRLPVSFSKGEGAVLWDAAGKEYLDALAGIAVCSLGHAHPAIAEALCDQASKVIHTTNIYEIDEQKKLGDSLTRISGMEKVFFGNSGAEANEAAIKIARLYGNRKKIKNPSIIVTEAAFHGRTLATLTASGSRKIQAGFEPLVQGFVRAPYNDLEAIENIAQTTSNIVAVMVEPVQGEGGIRIPDENYLTELRKICDQHEWLLILDEIQTGMCRTGKWFAYQHSDIKPDILTVAKSLGNGVPIGACLAQGIAAETFGPGNHGSTFGGNPLCCRVASTVIDEMEKQNLADRAEHLGNVMLQGFVDTLQDIDQVIDIRGKGLMLGIELSEPCPELVGIALEKGLLINVTSDSTIRLLPPLIISDDQANLIVERLSSIIKDYVNK
jgi:acetylornithine aminotransferase